MGDAIRGFSGRANPDGGQSPYLHWYGTDVFYTSGNSGTSSIFAMWGKTEPNTDNHLKIDPSRVVPTGAVNVPRSWGSLACAYFGQRSS